MTIKTSDSMSLGEAYRFITMYAKSVTLIQALREFFHNGAHALMALLRRGGTLDDVFPARHRAQPHIAFDLHYYRHGRSRTPKLAVVDGGCGMEVGELRNLIGTIASSGFRGGERKGMGAKIAGLNLSPWGLLYETWNGVDEPVRGILRLDHDQQLCGWVTDGDGQTFTHPAVRALHPIIRAAGHGTMVVFLGEHDADDTFTRFREELGRSKALAFFANTRYLDLPDGLRVAMATPRSKKDPHEVDLRTADVTGMRTAIEANADDYGVWEGEGYDIVWGYTAELDRAKAKAAAKANGKRRVDRYIHGDNCLTHQVVGVAIGDVEVPGLWEIYDLHTGPKGRALLAEFGVGPIASHVTLQIRIHDRERLDIDTNTERTMLLRDTKTLDLSAMAKAFRESMPQRLEEILVADIASRTVDHSRQIDKILERNAALFRPLKSEPVPAGDGERWRGGTGAGGGSTDGGGGGGGGSTDGGGGGGRTDSTNVTERPGRPGDRPGGWGAGGGGLPDSLRISTTVWLADNRPDEEADTLARYDQQNRILEINHDCWLIEEEVDLEMRQRGLTAQRDRVVVKDAVVFHITVCLIEGILRIERSRRAAGSKRGAYAWDFALEPQGLTAMAAARHHREWGISQSLKSKLGAKSR